MLVSFLVSFLSLSSTFSAAIDLRGTTPPAVALYEVDGYLDAPPKGAHVVEEILVGGSGRARLLYIVGYRRIGNGNPWLWLEDRYVFGPDFSLKGRPVDVDRFLAAPRRARVRGRFRTIERDHVLVILGLDGIDPTDAVD